MPRKKRSEFREEMKPLAEQTFAKFVENKQNGMKKIAAFRNAAHLTYKNLPNLQKTHLALAGVENQYVFSRIISSICCEIYPPRKRRTVAKAIINHLISHAEETRARIIGINKISAEEQAAEREFEIWHSTGQKGPNPWIEYQKRINAG